MNVLVLLLAWLATPPGSAQSADAARVPNLRVVEAGLFRSGRPEAGSYAQLHALGIKTILNLEGSRVASHERVSAAAFPEIRVVNVPMSGWRQPSFERLDDALQILVTAPRPILVHCRHGEDRTGVVVAAYRAAVERRTVSEAAGEAWSLHCCHMVTDHLDQLLDRYVAYRAGR